MHGRLFVGLLVFSSLIFAAPCAVRAQSYREIPAREYPTSPPLLRGPLPAPPVSPAPAPVALSQISRAAGIIFSGRVTAIDHRSASAGEEIETVAVTFHVDRAIRGVRNGETLTIKQWSGLWSGDQPFRTGERLFLFLYPPSRLGLTSSVGGSLGRFAVDSAGRILLSQQHSSAFRADRVLGGKSRVTFSDFAQHVQRASEEE
jgi:hypothetical protein